MGPPKGRASAWPIAILQSAAVLLVALGATAAEPPRGVLDDKSPPALTIETGAHSAIIRRLSVAEDRGRIVTASDDKTARVWDSATGNLLVVLRPSIGTGETGRLYGAAIHPTEDLVAVGGTTGRKSGEHRILL